jgi:hypothetical protein
MNRSHDIVFTARADVNGVLMGPFTLVSHLVEKHKYSLLVSNFGNYDLVFTPQYLPTAAGAWTTCTNVGATSPAGPYTLVAKAEKVIDFAFPAGVQWRIVGYGDGGVTEGRVIVEETDFFDNINDR